MKFQASIFAAPPPPLGGVASIVGMLQDNFKASSTVTFASPAPKQSGFFESFFRPLINIFRLIRVVRSTKKGGRILLFASAGYSFFEKLGWAFFILISNRRPVMIMVDGNFPEFWLNSSEALRYGASKVICHSKFELVAQSDSWQSYYKTLFPHALIKVAGATVAQDFFSADFSIRPMVDGVTAVFVGWVIQEKGILDLLDAMVFVHKINQDIRLRVIGPLFGREEFWNKAVMDRALLGVIEFIGPLHNRICLINMLRDSDIFVFPSHFEGFPVALLEALAVGLPCIGTEVGGIPDILDHGRAGLLVAARQPEQLADALIFLANNPSERQLLSEKALTRARQTYGSDQFIDTYKKLLGLM